LSFLVAVLAAAVPRRNRAIQQAERAGVNENAPEGRQ